VSTPPDPSLAEVAELLAQTWARRSGGERSAFIDTLEATKVTPAAPPREVMSAVSERAALSGAVAPPDLVRGMDSDEAAHALDVLAPEFDRTLADDRWTWTLRSGPRQQALASLAASETLSAALEDVAGIGTDTAGQTLRQLAAGQVQPSALFGQGTPSGPAPAALVQALAWAAPLGGFAGDLAEARRLARLAELADSYSMLLRYGIYGRKNELLRLRAFAEAPPDPSRPVPLLPVIGIGGSGKSTLLASFIQPYLDRLAADAPEAPAVVVIDFDRVLFRVNAEVELSFEVTRQLGYAAPVASADFSVLRYQAADQRRYTGTDVTQGSVAPESASRDTSDFESEAGVLVRMHGLQDRPVLLVLDTFEEWQRDRPFPTLERALWNDPEQRILEWISGLRQRMGLWGLRVVVSGRAGVSTGTAVEARQPLQLGDLDGPAARALLKAHKITGRAAGSLIRIAGSNPLTLRVAARFYLRLPPADRRRFLAGETGATAGLDAELRRAVLYDRFLSRIDDQRVRQLAHPGLVLRRVTADLVQYVLAGLCGLGEIDASTAAALTGKLADEIWLVRSAPDGLRHQPDVRRAMLRMMSADPEYAAIARQIHQAAVDWYTSGRDRDLSPQAAEVESFYHRMMLEAGDRPVLGGQWEMAKEDEQPSRQWAALAQALGEAVAEFPAGVAAQVRVLRGDDLRDDEAQFLTPATLNRWIARRGAVLVAEDQGALALDLLTTRLFRETVTEEPAWLAQACSDTVRWDDYWRIGSGLGASGPPRDELRSGRYAFLNSLCSRDPGDLERYDECLVRYLDSNPASVSPPPEVAERLFLDLLRALGVPAGRSFGAAAPRARNLQGLGRADGKGGEGDLYPVDQVRRALTWLESPQFNETFLLQRLAGLFRPSPVWLADFFQLMGADSSQHEDYLDSLATAAGIPLGALGRLPGNLGRPGTGKLRTHEVLGEWAARFARPWQNRAELRRDRLRDRPELINVLRGDNPELRPAIRRAIADAVPEDSGLVTLASIAQRVLPIPTADLHPDTVPPRNSPDARGTLVQLVEYVDRSGAMRDFLDALSAERPHSAMLYLVVRAFTIWDNAQERMLGALADRLREPPPRVRA
jgi:hypothetical protein